MFMFHETNVLIFLHSPYTTPMLVHHSFMRPYLSHTIFLHRVLDTDHQFHILSSLYQDHLLFSHVTVNEYKRSCGNWVRVINRITCLDQRVLDCWMELSSKKCQKKTIIRVLWIYYGRNLLQQLAFSIEVCARIYCL